MRAIVKNRPQYALVIWILLILSSIVLLSGCVGADESDVAGWDKTDGTVPVIWKNKVDGSIIKLAQEWDNSFCYLLTSKNMVYMIDMKNGKIQSSRRLPFEVSYLSEISGEKGTVAILKRNSRIFTLDMKSGKVLYDYDSRNADKPLRNVFVREETLIFWDQTVGKIVAIDLKTMKRKWTFGDYEKVGRVYLHEYRGRIFAEYGDHPFVEISAINGNVLQEFIVKYGAVMDDGNIQQPILNFADSSLDSDLKCWMRNIYSGGCYATKIGNHFSTYGELINYFGNDEIMNIRVKMPYKEMDIGVFNNFAIIKGVDKNMIEVLDLENKRILWQESYSTDLSLDFVYPDGKMLMGNRAGDIEYRDLNELK